MKLNLICRLMIALAAILSVSCSDDVERNVIEKYDMPDNLALEVADETPVIVKSEGDFSRLFGEAGENLRKVDFGKYNLIYIQGKSRNGITDIDSNWDTDSSPYRLSITIKTNLTEEYRNWSVAYLMPKSDPTPLSASVTYAN